MDLRIEAHTKEEIAKVPLNRLWFKRETVDFPLTDEQYEIFKKGYAPDWECRFAPVFLNGWFYITRSGFLCEEGYCDADDEGYDDEDDSESGLKYAGE